MSYHDALGEKLVLLSQSRTFYRTYKPALRNLQDKETLIRFAREKLVIAKLKVKDIEIDIEASNYFSISGTEQENYEHTQKLHVMHHHGIQQVQEYENVVSKLLNDHTYIELRRTVEEGKEMFNKYQSYGWGL
jgi:hypothetical protein